MTGRIGLIGNIADSRPRVEPTTVSTDLLLQAPAVLYKALSDDLWSGIEITPRLTDLAGITPAQWLSDPRMWLELVHPEDRARVVRERIQANSSGRLYCTYRLQREDGTEVWVLDDARVDSGRVYGALHDVTADHEAGDVILGLHTSVCRELQRLRAADAARQAFLGSFVHDLRAGLHRACYLLQSDRDQAGDADPASEAAREYLSGLREAVDDLLTLGDVGVGEALLRLREVRLRELIDVAIDEVGARERISLVDEQVGVAAVDPVLVRRMLVNLIANAVRHTPPDTAIRVHTFRTAESIMLSVEDDGPGVPETDRDRIFEPFVRLDGRMPGWGIGLSLVRRLVELHAGKVWVDDLPGGGASFTILLPQRRVGQVDG